MNTKDFFKLRVISLSYVSYHLCSTNTSDRRHAQMPDMSRCLTMTISSLQQ